MTMNYCNQVNCQLSKGALLYKKKIYKKKLWLEKLGCSPIMIYVYCIIIDFSIPLYLRKR